MSLALGSWTYCEIWNWWELCVSYLFLSEREYQLQIASDERKGWSALHQGYQMGFRLIIHQHLALFVDSFQSPGKYSIQSNWLFFTESRWRWCLRSISKNLFQSKFGPRAEILILLSRAWPLDCLLDSFDSLHPRIY